MLRAPRPHHGRVRRQLLLHLLGGQLHEGIPGATIDRDHVHVSQVGRPQSEADQVEEDYDQLIICPWNLLDGCGWNLEARRG